VRGVRGVRGVREGGDGLSGPSATWKRCYSELRNPTQPTNQPQHQGQQSALQQHTHVHGAGDGAARHPTPRVLHQPVDLRRTPEGQEGGAGGVDSRMRRAEMDGRVCCWHIQLPIPAASLDASLSFVSPTLQNHRNRNRRLKCSSAVPAARHHSLAQLGAYVIDHHQRADVKRHAVIAAAVNHLWCAVWLTLWCGLGGVRVFVV